MDRYFTIRLFGKPLGVVKAESERIALLKAIRGIKATDLHVDDLDPLNEEDAQLLERVQECERDTALGGAAVQRAALMRKLTPRELN